MSKPVDNYGNDCLTTFLGGAFFLAFIAAAISFVLWVIGSLWSMLFG